ncbi:hypothetical protein D6C84_01254 [Aureobasidium pullulans]|uniref:Lanthionine synthetase C-like protein n=2 Tax=Aureobasidium pullulans TaxID=5580 RepID=A0A1A7MT72_AURPU|nr:hypothetical protein JADG_001490 [Aureobasidium pullulans]OBW69580.1 MAG: Cytochrome P450 [Aureobasidium pullulans]THV86111.1 hypothetical protein D6D29_01801 [Aureobasidium pullulans]THV98249.1 hypothetical protein D6D27_01647 [Aureobasidium pullulans]THW08019.1 hypothetical protein D6D26_00587 [Aureobasidium pullulans]
MPPRYFKNDEPLSSRDPHKQLIASLTRLVCQYPPAEVRAGGGIYNGPTSVAYLFLVLQQLYSDLIIEGIQLGTWSATYLKQSQDHIKSFPGPRVGKCGIADDILALLAIGAASSKDADMAAELCDYSAEVLDDASENEWLYGRAGYLYYLRLVKAAFVDDARISQMITDTQDDVVEAILKSERPWKWHGKSYVGAVHGLIGIITQVTLTDPERYSRAVEADLSVLLTYQYESGNWPSSLPPGKDKLVHVCHGAPGVVNSLLSIKDHFPKLQSRIDSAIRKGRDCILERGLLTKEPCLCHGISGNALALDDEHCQHFLTYTTGHEMKGLEKDGLVEKSDSPESLWCGEAGRAWAWAVMDKGLPKRLLGYNDI